MLDVIDRALRLSLVLKLLAGVPEAKVTRYPVEDHESAKDWLWSRSDRPPNLFPDIKYVKFPGALV